MNIQHIVLHLLGIIGVLYGVFLNEMYALLQILNSIVTENI